jgi:hypothetical protein
MLPISSVILDFLRSITSSEDMAIYHSQQGLQAYKFLEAMIGVTSDTHDGNCDDSGTWEVLVRLVIALVRASHLEGLFPASLWRWSALIFPSVISRSVKLPRPLPHKSFRQQHLLFPLWSCVASVSYTASLNNPGNSMYANGCKFASHCDLLLRRPTGNSHSCLHELGSIVRVSTL